MKCVEISQIAGLRDPSLSESGVCCWAADLGVGRLGRLIACRATSGGLRLPPSPRLRLFWVFEEWSSGSFRRLHNAKALRLCASLFSPVNGLVPVPWNGVRCKQSEHSDSRTHDSSPIRDPRTNQYTGLGLGWTHIKRPRRRPGVPRDQEQPAFCTSGRNGTIQLGTPGQTNKRGGHVRRLVGTPPDSSNVQSGPVVPLFNQVWRSRPTEQH